MTILAVDVDYRDRAAVVAGVDFEQWEDEQPIAQAIVHLDSVLPYEPGHFYKRELPCILEFLRQRDRLPHTIATDGYVYLDELYRGERQAGLGKHLFDALQAKVAIVGVAKTRFKGVPREVEVFRGGSLRPLYVTAVGIDLDEAKSFILKMSGKHRIPTMLKLVDRLCRKS